MKELQLRTTGYRHEGFFKFKDQYYILGSYVKLTEYGKEYLEAHFDEVQLTKHFFIPKNGKEIECWGFVVQFRGYPPHPHVMSTDEPLEKLIEEVIIPAKYEPTNKKPEPIKIKNRDWEVPDVLLGWLVFLVFFFGVEIFKDWAVKLILRLAGGWFFSNWRNLRMIEEGYVDFSDKKKQKQVDEDRNSK